MKNGPIAVIGRRDFLSNEVSHEIVKGIVTAHGIRQYSPVEISNREELTGKNIWLSRNLSPATMR